ncbi:MAG: HEPN domain-containing protein [Chloroflexota bacterium]
MKENTQFLLEKAENAIGAAESLLRDGYRDFAAGRAYYAMFYAAEALLAEKELTFKKHVGVHKAFSEHFIKTDILNRSIITGWLPHSTAAWWEIMHSAPNLKTMK